MTKQEFIDWALDHGWCLDRYGHLQRGTGLYLSPSIPVCAGYRLKLSSIAVRYEGRSHAKWVRLKSQYYSRLSVSQNGKLAGLSTVWLVDSTPPSRVGVKDELPEK